MGKTQVTPTMPAIPPLMSLAGRLKGKREKKVLQKVSCTISNFFFFYYRASDGFGLTLRNISALNSEVKKKTIMSFLNEKKMKIRDVPDLLLRHDDFLFQVKTDVEK